MPNLNKIIKKVLLEQFDIDEMREIESELERYSDKMNDVSTPNTQTVDEIIGIDGFVRNTFIPKLMSDIKNGEYGYTTTDVIKGLRFLNKIHFTFNVIEGEKIPIKIKKKMYKEVLTDKFCPNCKSSSEVRKYIEGYIQQNTPKSKQPPIKKVKSKKYTPSKGDMERLERLAKTSSKANDVWRKYGIGSKTLKMGDHTVTIQLNKDITIGNQDLKTKETYETTFDKDTESLIYRIKNVDIYFEIEHTPLKGEKYEVININVIDRQGKNLKTPVPKPKSLLVGILDVKEN